MTSPRPTAPRSPRTPRALKVDKLKRRIDPATLGFETTNDCTTLDSVIEQTRAFEALRLGSSVHARNYNIYVSGRAGTGKLTAVKKVLAEIAARQPAPGDTAFVHNFLRAWEPSILHFPRGRGVRFQRAIEELIGQLAHKLPQVYHSREYQGLVQDVVSKGMEAESEAFLKLSEEAKSTGFAVKSTKDGGLITVPLYNNRPLSDKEYDRLPADVKRKIEDRRKELTPHLQEFLQHTRELQLHTQSGVDFLQKQLIAQLVKPEIERLKHEFGPDPAVLAYLDALIGDMDTHPEKMLPDSGPDTPPRAHPERGELREYQVNLLVDNSATSGRPIVYEKNPTFPNLVGRIDRVVEQGAVVTDFTMIRAGSILKANGGYLLLNAFDLLTRPQAWLALKNALKNRELVIEDMGEQVGFPATTGLKPEPIPVDLKVVLMGNAHLHALLYHYDEDFQKLFQVVAEFDQETPDTKRNRKLVSRFVATIVKKEGLRPVHAEGVARMLEAGMRKMDHQARLSMLFGDLANLAIEADYFARKARADVVRGEHVEHAVRARIERRALTSEKIRGMYEDHTLLLDVQGARVGQVNALAVYETAGFAFGKPMRITAQTFAGKGGVVNVEREAKMAGRVFQKAALILAAWLRARFAAEAPLSLNVSLAFEQSYGGIEGDSASIAEAYAILSAISGLPVDQGISMTGSMSQMGEVQAIGGVNEKIEGYFEICKARGLTGTQGVIIPWANTLNLVLVDEVLEAAGEGRFRVWAIRSIEEGVPLLFGLPAGEPDEQGRYPDGTLFGACQARLEQLRESDRRRRRRSGDRGGADAMAGAGGGEPEGDDE